MLAVSLALFAAACYNLVLVVLILLKTPPRLVGRNVAWYLLCIAAWILTTAVLTHPAADHATALLATRAAYVCATIGVACWMLFCADLLPATRSFKRFAWVHIILGIPWLFLSWTDLIIADMSARPWGTHTVVGPLILLFGVWLAVGLTASITHLILCLRRTRGMQRLQIRYILLGTAVMGACGLLFNVVLPAVATSTDYAYCGPLSSVFMSSVTAYAIMRYRLLDIRIVLRAGLIYSITIGLLSLLFALLLPAFDRVFTFHLLPDTHTGSFLLAYFMALAYQPLRRRVQEAVDQHFFYEGIYDYRQSLREACHALAGQKDQQLILNTLIGVITQTLHPDGIAVYLPERDGVLSVVTSTRSRSALPNTLPPDSPVLVYAQQANDVILTEEQLRRADPHYSIGMQMHDWQIHAVIPLIANGHLSAIVFLGEKISGDVFFPEDSALLRTLGAQAALALDNVRQYEEMAEMNEYHQRLLNIMEDGVVALDPFGRVLTFNAAAERITGIPTARAIGRRLPALGLPQFPANGTEEHFQELLLRTREGYEIPVSISVTPFFRHWDVAECHLVVIRDLSELRLLEQEKLGAERFSSMGAMAASLAHEIKNPLVPIQTFAHLLPQKYADEEFRREFIPTVLSEVQRIDTLVSKMVDLVHNPAVRWASVDLREIVRGVLRLVRPECDRQGIKLHLYFADDLPFINGVEEQLYQVLLNIFNNAVQAMPHGGEIAIAVHAVGSEVVCKVTDTGPGVPKEDLHKIFEPLFTTKLGGHGMGLALAFRFVRSHRGDIHAECAAEGGLSLTITLPVLEAVEDESSPTPAPVS